MRFDIVPLQSNYRGIERSICPTDIYTACTKKVYSDLLEQYLRLESIREDYPNQENFMVVISFYRTLCKYGIDCEVIVYDEVPLLGIYGHNLMFLGIDITRDLCESCISSYQASQALCKENTNGLFRNREDAERYIMKYLHGNQLWKPCWVYRIIC